VAEVLKVSGSARRAQDSQWTGRVSLPSTVIARFPALPLTRSVFNGRGCFSHPIVRWCVYARSGHKGCSFRP
jgi:hypothetical protein